MIGTPAGLLFGFGLPDAPEGDNPFTLVYNSIWNLLLARPNFVQHIKHGNRISFVGQNPNAQFTKEFNKLSADFPEVQITVEGATPAPNDTSSSSKLSRTYAIMLHTDGATLDPFVFPVEWEIFQALAAWRFTVSALEYKGERFVKNVAPLPVTNAYSLDAAQNVRGWVAVWRARVDMYFSNVNLGV